MIGRDQMLAPVLDPLYWTLELERGGADQNVFGIDFATYAEATADMTFVELNGCFFPPQHVRDCIAIPVRHLGGAMQLQNVTCLIVACNSTTRFERNAGVATNGKLKRHNGVGVAEG